MLPVQPVSIGVSAKPAAVVSTPESAPTSVTSRPSRIQVTPSATTTSQWNRRQGSASSRAGISVVTISGPTACSSACAMLRKPLRPLSVALVLRTRGVRLAAVTRTSGLRRTGWTAAVLAALAATLWLGLAWLGLAAHDSREPFVESRVPPDLAERFYPPEGWAWGLVQLGDGPALRYGVAAPDA